MQLSRRARPSHQAVLGQLGLIAMALVALAAAGRPPMWLAAISLGLLVVLCTGGLYLARPHMAVRLHARKRTLTADRIAQLGADAGLHQAMVDRWHGAEHDAERLTLAALQAFRHQIAGGSRPEQDEAVLQRTFTAAYREAYAEAVDTMRGRSPGG